MQVYQQVKDAAWSSQICQLVSSMVALLAKAGRQHEMDTVLRDTHGRLGLSEKTKFGCALVGSYAQLGLWADALQQFDALSCFAGPQRFRSLLRAQASMNLPQEAEKTFEELRIAGYEPCADDYKSLMFSYGRCGDFESMGGVLELMRDHEQAIDTTIYNMMLVSYGMAHKYFETSLTLQRMLDAGIAPSIKTMNALTNACPSLLALITMKNTAFIPCSDSLLDEIVNHFSSIEELSIVERVLELGLPPESTVWVGTTWTLNLHNMAMGTAYLMLMLWLKELAFRLKNVSAPDQVGLITGWGKHSELQGDCLVKAMAVAKLSLMQSPFKADRYNKGRLVARGHIIRGWLLSRSQAISEQSQDHRISIVT
ncbi:hypothetical protein O6H91_07G012100 [Diphasiastrum complanatum]|uniref:Uncharacterized protein n=1 Tax=Diphasiastrum complanatum TaxID=34168 RepID=A0ACC2D2E5_DIPCM|nr:hypothetical protein O6H91_07G012100 [Diphasiastrum complanatum]